MTEEAFYHPEGGKVSATAWPPTAVSYAEGVNVSAGCTLLSIIRPKISKSTRVTGSDYSTL